MDCHGRLAVVVVGMLLLALLCGPGRATAAEMSDARKLQLVYRMYGEYRQDAFSEVPDIAPERARELHAAGKAVFVDVRTPAEMAVSRLPGAVTPETFARRRAQYRDKTVVAYCTISYRSGVWLRDLENGDGDFYNLKGGLLAWVLAGGTVYNDDGPTRRIHVYGDKWNYPPRGYEAVTFGLFERLTQ